MGYGVISAPDPEKRNTKIILCFCIGGINCDGFFVMGNCVVELTLFDQKAAQVIMCLGVIRSQINSSPVVIDRLFRFSLLAQNDAEIVMRHPATRIFL